MAYVLCSASLRLWKQRLTYVFIYYIFVIKSSNRINNSSGFISYYIAWNPLCAFSTHTTHILLLICTNHRDDPFKHFSNNKNGQQINISKYEEDDMAEHSELNRRNYSYIIIIVIKEYKRWFGPKQANKLNRLLLNFLLLNKLVSLTVSSVLNDRKIVFKYYYLS